MNDLEKEGSVQRFEYTVELAWKSLKDYLEFSGLELSSVDAALLDRGLAEIQSRYLPALEALRAFLEAQPE